MGQSGCVLIPSTGSHPAVYDCTGGASAVGQLVDRAIAGLGFLAREGPREGDLIFVGRTYMAWIDDTGYSGKLNGLWALNGDLEHLDFNLVEPDFDGSLRPINMLLPGEDGDGRWPEAYNGAEHYEMPRFHQGRHVAQAGLREANHFGPRAPNSWRSCINADTRPERWDTSRGETQVEVLADGIRVENRAPLQIVANFDSTIFPCGSEFPFNDEQTGQMDLVLGYRFYRDDPRIERTYQLINASPNDYAAQSAVDKLIGGLLVTDWPRPHYLKQFQLYGSWDESPLAPNAPFDYAGRGQTADYIEVRGEGTRRLSATRQPKAGRSLVVSQEGGLGDVGLCLCHVHGGFEVGGSVLANLQLPAAGERRSPRAGPVHRRTMVLDGDRRVSSAAEVESQRLEAEDPGSGQHQVGAAVGAFWEAPAGVQPGFLYFMNYVPIPMGVTGQAAFSLSIDGSAAPGDVVATVDLILNGRELLASRSLRAGDFLESGAFRRFVLDFEAREGGTIEPRVHVSGRTAVALDRILLNWTPAEAAP